MRGGGGGRRRGSTSAGGEGAIEQEQEVGGSLPTEWCPFFLTVLVHSGEVERYDMYGGGVQVRI